MRIGVLVSGGDCPGLNAAVRGAVLRGTEVHGDEYVGYFNGWQGVLESSSMELNRKAVRGISPLGGTILGTSRVSPFTPEAGGIERIKERMGEDGIDAFLTIGGNGTQTVANMLHDADIPVVGLPKTIDNDLEGTDQTFGFDTAVTIATEAIDRLRTTGASHQRCMVLEVMGRDAGWISLNAGVAGGSQVILLSEFPESLDQIVEWVQHCHERGRSVLVTVAEGFKIEGESETVREGLDGFGRARLGGIAEKLAPMIEEASGIESRATVLGHVQRGGSPTAFDRVLATRSGIHGADALHSEAFGHMVGIHADEMTLVPLHEVAGKTKQVPARRYEGMRKLFG